jgi:hypothetical protein
LGRNRSHYNTREDGNATDDGNVAAVALVAPGTVE